MTCSHQETFCRSVVLDFEAGTVRSAVGVSNCGHLPTSVANTDDSYLSEMRSLPGFCQPLNDGLYSQETLCHSVVLDFQAGTVRSAADVDASGGSWNTGGTVSVSHGDTPFYTGPTFYDSAQRIDTASEATFRQPQRSMGRSFDTRGSDFVSSGNTPFAKDPNKPKRPASAFFVFMEDCRKQYKEKHPKNKAVSAVGNDTNP